MNKGDLQAIFFYGGLMLVSAFISLAFGQASARYAAYVSAGFAKNVRTALFKKIQSFSFANIDQFSSGSLVTRMMTDVTNIQNSYQMIIRICVRAPLNFLFAIIAAFYINAGIAQIFIYVSIFLVMILFLVIKIVFPRFQEVFKAYDGLNSSVQENITNMRVIKSYVKEADETKKFQKESGRILACSCVPSMLLSSIHQPCSWQLTLVF